MVANVYEDDNFSGQVPEKKDYASVSKVVHKQKTRITEYVNKNYKLLSKKNTQM